MSWELKGRKGTIRRDGSRTRDEAWSTRGSHEQGYGDGMEAKEVCDEGDAQELDDGGFKIKFVLEDSKKPKRLRLGQVDG